MESCIPTCSIIHPEDLSLSPPDVDLTFPCKSSPSCGSVNTDAFLKPGFQTHKSGLDTTTSLPPRDVVFTSSCDGFLIASGGVAMSSATISDDLSDILLPDDVDLSPPFHDIASCGSITSLVFNMEHLSGGRGGKLDPATTVVVVPSPTDVSLAFACDNDDSSSHCGTRKSDISMMQSVALSTPDEEESLTGDSIQANAHGA